MDKDKIIIPDEYVPDFELSEEEQEEQYRKYTEKVKEAFDELNEEKKAH